MLNPKFQDSGWSLYLSRPVWVLPGRKPRRQIFSWCGSFYCLDTGNFVDFSVSYWISRFFPLSAQGSPLNVSKISKLHKTFFECQKVHMSHLLMPYANNKGADQPACLGSLIITFVVHCLDSIISLVSICTISSLYIASHSLSVSTQAGLCLTWSETP